MGALRRSGQGHSREERAKSARPDHAGARKDPQRHPRVAARWLLRLLEEDPDVTIQEAALAASSLVALPGTGYPEAAQTLKAMSERASRRRRETGAA